MSVGEVEQLRGAPLILALKTGNEARLAPPGDQMIWVGSVLGVLGKRESVNDFANNQLCQVQTRLRNFADLFNPTRAGISEAVIPPNSRWIKKAVGELRLRKTHGISVLAVNRGDQVFREDVRTVALRAGDTLVLHSFWRDLAQTAESHDFVVVTDYPKDEQRPAKIWYAVAFFGLAMGLGLFTDIKLSVAMLAGAVGMLLSGVLNMDEAYGAINWKTIFTLACLVPLGWAMDSTGAANWVAQQTLQRVGTGVPIWVLQAALGLLTTFFALVIGNVGATVVMVPMGINIALAAGGNPAAFALLVALSASNNFLTASNPVLAMITGPTGYRPRDLWRTGLPLTGLYMTIVLLVVNFLV
jgi:di/tricarboxylate transporter